MIDKYINTVIHGDCLEVMRSIPNDIADITFADPPFNLKKNRKLKSQHSQFADSGGNMVGDTGGYLFTI